MAYVINPKWFALRPFRVILGGRDMRLYTATTFPKNPSSGCDLYLRRIGIFGGIDPKEVKSDYAVDVLSSTGDLLDTFELSRSQFQNLKRWLRFKVDRGD